MIRKEIKCEICSDRPARKVVLRRRSGEMYKTLVCDECAEERSRVFAGGNLDLGGLIARMDRKSASYGCRACGTTLADIVVDGKPGCCLCYTRFSGEVLHAVENMQGRTYHVGKTPAR